MIIDSHCHLNRLKFTNETSLSEIIKEARDLGVKKIISVSINFEELVSIKKIANTFNGVYYSVGVHPSETEGRQPTHCNDLLKISKNTLCVAIGETGLDYINGISKNTKFKQREKFDIHLEASILSKKPVIIHTRNARKDTLEIIQSKLKKPKGVIHCFTENWESAKKFLDMGMYISFSGIVTFKNAREIQLVAKKVPLDRILVETDSPYLTPTPYRGKPNYPKYVYYTAKFLAELRGENFEKFCKETSKNAKLLFSLK